MRTTVRLPDDLMRAAKRRAVDTGRTLTDVIADALRAELSRRAEAHPVSAVELPTFGAGGILPGVDLDDTAAMLELMEDPR